MDFDRTSQNSTVTDCTTNTDDDGGKRKVHKKIVYHGIQLRLKNEKSPFYSYIYARSPVTARGAKVDWKMLTSESVESEHIVCHQLQPGNNLGTLIAHYKASLAVAIIFINTDDDYELADEFKATLSRKKEKYPVVIITSDDGKHLHDFLDHHEIGDIVARIEPLDQLPVDQLNQSINERVAALRNAPSSRRSALKMSAMFKHGTKKLAVDLKEDVKNLMFTPSGPLCVSEDMGHFQGVMGLFYQYEQMVHVEKHATDGAIFRKLLKHMDETFTKDFPFYLILAYRVHKKQHLYQCEELPLFIQTCIEKYEKLPADKLLLTLAAFQRHDDFKIMYEARVATNTVFSMLEDACIELMMQSFAIKNKNSAQGHLPSRYVYCRMLWISSAMKFHVIRGAIDVPHYWTDHFTKTAQLSLDADNLRDIDQGMKLCSQLEIPEKFAFNSTCLAELVASDGYIRPFTQMVEFLNALQSRFSSEEEFVQNFMRRPRLCFAACFHQSFEDTLGLLSPDRNLLHILKEGLNFLNAVLDLCRRKGWKGIEMDEEMKGWLTLLLEQVDVTSDAAIVQLEDFLSTGVGPACKQYREHIKRQVICAIKDKFSTLPVEKFFKLYKSFFIWPNWFVEEYLQKYKIAKDETICSPMWCNFFSEFVERYSEAQHHKTLLEFLKSVGDTYQEQRRAKNFVLDLLHIDVSKLFAEGHEKPPLQHEGGAGTSEEFSAFLCTYIQKFSISGAVLQDINLIWESILNENEFQSTILRVLQRELVPDAVALKGSLSKPVQTILSRSLEILCTKAEEVSPKHKFCWGFVATCCSKICISEDIQWMVDHYGVVEQLGRIYSAHCINAGLKGEDCILKEVVLPVHAPNDMRTYFKWVKEAQGVLKAWKRDFVQKKLGYGKITEYYRSFGFVNRMSVALSAETLVIPLNDVKKYQDEYQRRVEDLGEYLLRSIGNHPEIPSCTLLQLLSKYGVTLPPPLLKEINHCVLFPDEERTEEASTESMEDTSLQLSLSLQFTKKVQPVIKKKIQLTKGVTLHQLKEMVQGLEQFLRPVMQHVHVDHTKILYLDILVFFYHQSEIFDKYLKLQLLNTQTRTSKPTTPLNSMFKFPTAPPAKDKTGDGGVPIGDLVTALQKTLDLMKDLLKGEVSYTNLVADGSLDLKSIDLDAEFEILKNFASFRGDETVNLEGLEGIKCMLQLFQFGSHIETIGSVCHQYQLQGCLSDPTFIELVSLSKDLETSKSKLTPRLAIEKMGVVRRVLCLQDRKGVKFLDIFCAVAESGVFHQFVVSDNGFVGKAGQSRFSQQYNLITTHLQHEEYDEAVYNHLYAAFQYITPFTDKEQSFGSLMEKVANLNVSDGCKQLETINRNIHLIRLWFSRAEGDTLKNVATELDCILSSGYFRFTLITTAVGESAKAVLKYTYTTKPKEGTASAMQGTPGEESLKEVVWNEEQVRDFVRRLGFLDANETVKEQFDRFLYSNQVAFKLLEVYIKLKELGHPQYCLHQDIGLVLPCCISPEKAEQRLLEASTTLSQWEKDVTQLRTEYEQLLYFSVPKLLQLYKLITASDPSTTKIVQEVSFLFQNEASMRLRLKEVVKIMLENNKHKYREERKGLSTYMHVVGIFLSELFKTIGVSAQSPSRRRPPTSNHITPSHSTHVLHSCCGFSQNQLVRLIISIYGGIPEPFEVFHCQQTTTEEELRLFLNPKRPTRHPFQYLILEVNNLQYQLQEILLKLHFDLRQQFSASEMACIHFVETAPSLLHDMPWILFRDYKGSEPAMDMEQARIACLRSAMNPDDFSCVQIVYGDAGNGKTHYITSQLKQCPQSLHITISETFTVLNVIKKLNSIPIDEKGCGIFFNFTLLPPGESVDEVERLSYKELINKIGWFFFDLFILGYVEDPVSGASFRLPGGASWAVYIEVPTLGVAPEDSLQYFRDAIPALGLLGTPHPVYSTAPYVVDDDVQLVCKYLRAYKTNKINRLYKESHYKFFGGKNPQLVKFSLEEDLRPMECHALLTEYTPSHMMKNKTLQKLFIKYMRRRCAFLDTCPAFYMNSGASEFNPQTKTYNDTRELGSTLMGTMLKEVSDFCDPIIMENWSLKPHHQLIYDFQDGGGSFGLMTLHPDQIPEEDKEKFRKLGIKIPSLLELYNREYLDMTLSRALNVPLNNNRLTPIDDASYVLTLDFAVKMLNIHERAECRVPVIIEGETGVGKTALIEMMSKLWNYSTLKDWNREKIRLLDFIKAKLAGLPATQKFSHILQKTAEDITEEDLILIGELEVGKSSSELFYSALREKILVMRDHPVLSLLELATPCQGEDQKSLGRLIAAAEYKDNSKSTAKLVCALLNARVQSTFHKLNVHAALQPADIFRFFQSIFEQAKRLEAAFTKNNENILKVPFVTVFLDEVNTSSCLGLLKEVIVDRTLEGERIPENIFIVGACNPHRGNSLATHDTWLRGTYYVRQLHPTLQCLTWDYGALGEQQEGDYIKAKLELVNKTLSNIDLANLTNLIAKSQKLMRSYAYEQLQAQGLNLPDASAYSRSCVSQRDIQRVFTFYEWLLKMYAKCTPYGKEHDYNSRSVLVSLGIVYYLRLNDKYRKRYQKELDPGNVSAGGLPFLKTFDDELTWYIEQFDLPDGIAKTRALKENIFATIVCTMTHTPLIIVGSPGSSKTLSFNLTLANLKGHESKKKLFRETAIFKSLDPQFYQCSRRTTSTEIDTVFSRAINRQRSHIQVGFPIYCVVFMDEAGLPEEKRESLKVLHYLLDKGEVSFVAITNHILDAAKTNRAVSLYRQEASREDLETLAKGCLCKNPENPPPELRRDVEVVASFCPAYEAVMGDDDLKKFFGLRDFIHFISYLRRNREQMLSPELVMKALERNFNGVKPEVFERICTYFLSAVKSSPAEVLHHNIFDILSSSLADHPKYVNAENDMRYKLVIDPSEDGSLVRLLFSCGVLQRSKTRVYMCSEFSGDAELHKINTIAAVRLSAAEGHTVILNQTDAIHESFYDLFNRRFHRIDSENGPRFYANIAIGAHIKPCRIHPNFECIVVVKESDLATTPPPFLNRFEKYFLSYKTLLEAMLQKLPSCLRTVIETAQFKAQEFLNHIGGASSIYGLQETTLDSILLTILPSRISKDCEVEEEVGFSPIPKASGMLQTTYLLQMLLAALQKTAGFRFPEYISSSHLELDAKDVFAQVLKDPEFSSEMSKLDTDERVREAVEDGLAALKMEHKGKEKQATASNRACMVVAILLQWLVRHLCKCLMQMMTSEAICLYHRKIPESFGQCYLEQQTHFSLKATIENSLAALEMSQTSTSSPTKLLCFTRSSQQIHQLPVQYPLPARASIPLSPETKELLKELVHSNTEELAILKLSHFSSHSAISEQIKAFVESTAHKVFLLVANTQEVSKNIINHLRIMIEEAEIESQSKKHKKLFVLLLHFPFSCLSKPCYPFSFLHGWNFMYLDVIGYNAATSVMNVREWFKQHYCLSGSLSSQHPLSSVTAHTGEILREAIPVISSRVSFGSYESAPFNRPMSIPERNEALQKILLHKGVGEVLLERFGTYWHYNVLIEYLEKEALFAHNHETTVSVLDSLECNLKALFFDFLTYMVSRINEELNFDLLCTKDCPPEVQEMFVKLLRVYPIPEFTELKTLHVQVDTKSLSRDEAVFAIPAFPFYTFVSGEIENLVEQSRKQQSIELHQTADQLDEPLSLLHTIDRGKTQTMKILMDLVCKKLEEAEKSSVLGIITQSLEKNNDLWKRYFQDFIYQQICHNQSFPEITHKVLQATLGDLEHQSMTHKLTIIHVYFHVHKFHLPTVINILRPLDSVFAVALGSLKVQVPPDEDVLERPEALSNFVMDTLFNAVLEITTSNIRDSTRENLRLWYKAYQDVMMMSSLKQYIYSRDSVVARAQHNLMHMLYLILKSKPSLSNDIVDLGAKIFIDVRTKFFHSSPTTGPLLEHVATAAVEGVTGQTFEAVIAQNNPQARCILEGMLDYLFAEDRTVFNIDDCKWFLNLANMQHHWQAEYLMDAVINVDQNDDLVSELEHNTTSPAHLVHSENQSQNGCLPIATFKFYLMRYISYCIANQEQTFDTPLLSYQILKVHTLAIEVLRPTQSGAPGPYIPTFYQHCASISRCEAADNKLMQQPLVHLYFITILEKLLRYSYDLPAMIKMIHKIGQECEGEAASLGEKILLYIEEQAVVQLLIRQLAKILCSKSSPNLIQLTAVVKDVNTVLDDDSMGGGEAGGHRAVLALHMLTELRSFNAFNELFTTQYNQLCADINCLKAIHTALQSEAKTTPQRKKESRAVYEEFGSEFYSLYQKVCAAMQSIDGQPTRAKELVNVAEECTTGGMKLLTRTDRTVTISKLSCFKMAMWLCAYHEFFAKNKPSVTVATMVKNHLNRILEPEYVHLLVWILEAKKRTDTLRPVDPLSNLFTASGDQDLQTILVLMVTMVVGCPSRTNSMWYSMFSPNELVATYIPGSLAQNKIGPDTVFLDQSVELTKDGLVDQLLHRYLDYASSKGALSLQSLYFVLWTNFAGLSMSLLTQPSAEEKVVGKIVSGAHPIRQHCASQLEALWVCMLNNYCISVEERLLLMKGCLLQWFEEIVRLPQSESGRFLTHDSVHNYERLLHSDVFMPCFKALKNDFLAGNPLLKNEVFACIRELNCRYPWFSTKGTLLDTVLSTRDSSTPSAHLYPLSQFVINYERLQLIGQILPGLLELYQWLHTELAYALSYENTKKTTISKVAKAIAKESHGNEDKTYEKLKDAYNSYIRLTNANKADISRLLISDDTPLLNMLSYTTEGEHGNDLFFSVIQHMVTFHNQFVKKVLSAPSAGGHTANMLTVRLAQFTQQCNVVVQRHCAENVLLELIHKRSHLPVAFPLQQSTHATSAFSNLPGQLATLIHLPALQEDILTVYIAGRPMIDPDSVAQMRTPFRFRDQPALHLNLQDCTVGLADIAEKLPESFRASLDGTCRKQIECEFHSAGYHAIMEVVIGLRTAVGHLIKATTTSSLEALKSKTLLKFLCTLYELETNAIDKVFTQIGIHSLTVLQYKHLSELNLQNLFQTLNMFARWAEDGWYNFCSLPLAAKLPLNPSTEAAVHQIVQKYDHVKLQKDLKGLVQMLVHLEAGIVKAVTVDPKKCLKQYLKDLNIWNDQDELVQLLPDDICLEHYVSFRLILRRIISDTQRIPPQEDTTVTERKHQDEVWSDHISDLWVTKLPYLRGQQYVYTTKAVAASQLCYHTTSEMKPSSEIVKHLIQDESVQRNLLECVTTDPSRGFESSAEIATLMSNPRIARRLINVHEAAQEGSVLEERAKAEWAKAYNVKRVVDFLRHINMEQYTEAFKSNSITGELLIALNDEDLIELGINNSFHRFKITFCFQREVSKQVIKCSPEMVARLLENDANLRQYVPSILRNGVDGEMLLQCDKDQVLKELEITPKLNYRRMITLVRSFIANN